MKISYHLSIIACLALVACERPAPVSPVQPDEAAGLARDAAQEAFGRLSGELAKAMEAGGPVAAIAICSQKAGPLVSETAVARHLEMMRVSDRPRNPKQQANAADLEAIAVFRDQLKQGGQPKPVTTREEDGAVTVRMPIPLSQPLCLQCHGGNEDIAPETRKAILTEYPQDKATGYQLNDLRGIWRIRVSADAAQ